MSYYSAEEMKKTLKDYPKFQKRLYCRGFLITNEKQNVNLEYPFYANWKEETIDIHFICIRIRRHMLIHMKEIKLYIS